jgi:hypothetical protein
MTETTRPPDEGNETSIAHRGAIEPMLADRYPEGMTRWLPAQAPEWPAETDLRMTGRLRACAYCGSMHPVDVAAAIRAGAVGHFADRKYGWPHKAYFDRIPNPHAGMLESRSGASFPPPDEIAAGKWIRVRSGFDPRTGEPSYFWRDAGKPAPALTHGKFYTLHPQDATPADRDIIELHLGFRFVFDRDPADGRSRVSWTQAVPK